MKLSFSHLGFKKALAAMAVILAVAGTGIAALSLAHTNPAPNGASAVSEAEGTVIYSNSLGNETDFKTFTVLKGETNTSNNQWKFYKYGPNVQYSIYMSDSGDADSYLFIPSVAFDASKSYTIAVDAMNDANNDDYKATLEFGYATTASIEAYTAANEVTIPSSLYETVASDKFTPAEGATYAVLRVHFQKPEGVTAGYMGLKAINLVITEFEGTVGGGDQGGDEPPAVDTGKEVYKNTFDAESDFTSGTVVRGAENPTDNASEWKYYKYDPKYIRYTHYMTNAGTPDCYMFIPVSVFNSDKSYTIAVDGKTDTGSGNPYDSAIEFGYATDATIDAYTAVSSVTVPYAKEFTTYTSDKFTPAEGAAYAVIRVHYTPDASAKGSIETIFDNLVITEFEGTVGGGDQGGDEPPAVDTGKEVYKNAFDAESDFTSGTVVRGAENPTDNASEWKYYKYDPKYIRYTHYMTNAGTPDCYLFIPVSVFNSDKSYTIAVDGKTDTGSGNPYDSAIEFGYATDATIDAYTAVSSVTVPYAKEFTTYTSDKFTPAEGAAYAVIRVHYTPDASAKGSIETIFDNLVITEFEGTVGGGDQGGDEPPAVDTGKEVYKNAFDAESDFTSGTVVRGAENPTDNASEWKYYKYDPKYIRYTHYMTNAGTPDCYLFIPVSVFNSDKSYTIAVDGKTDTGSGNPYDSAIEFGYATDATIDAYTAVSSVTVPYAKDFTTYTSDKFTPAEGAAYAVIRVHYTPDASAKGSIETIFDNLVITEFEGTVGGGDQGGDEPPAVDTGKDVYKNAFDAESDFTSGTVVRGAENPTDNASEWKYYKYDPKYIRYTHYMTNAGTPDCYLFIPVSVFNSDKSYTIAVDGKTDTGSGNPYDSAIEFGYATDATIDAYTAVSSVTVPYAKEFTTYTSDKFTPANGANYAVIRVHYTPDPSAKGGIETIFDNLVITEFEGTVGGGNQGGDEPPTVGEGKPLPYFIVPTADELDDLTILDNNNDEDDHGTYVCGVWSYDPNEEALYYLYSMTDNADDYVFLPLLYFDDADKAYEISLDTKVASRNNPEKFEICIGTSQNPDDLRVVYTSGNVVNDEEWENVAVPVGIEKAGDYYVAVHATSSKNDFRLYVKNISVKQLETSPKVPEAPTAISAKAGEKGALNAEVTFTMPSISISGSELTGDVTVTLASTEETKEVTAGAGETVSATVKTVQGDNNITLSAKNSFGEGNSAVVTVFTGVDKPFAPQPVAKASADNMTLVISWEQSEVGINGGYVDPATVQYTLFRYDNDEKFYDDGTVVTGVTKYEYTCPAGSPQHRESFLITAKNVAGQAEGGTSISGVIGTPYQLPMTETLAKGRLTYEPLSTEAPDNSYSPYSDFRVYDLGTIFETPDPNYEGILDEHKTAIWGFIRYGEPGNCRFLFPKFSTKDTKEAKLKMNVFLNSVFPEVAVYASAYEAEPVKIGTISKEDGEGWTTLAFAIPESMGNVDWVQVYLEAEITDIDSQNIFISGYSFTQLLESDMALESLTGTDQALSVGEKSEYVAVVRNEGKTAAAAPNVVFTLYKGDEVVATETVSANTVLQPEEAAEYVCTVEATADNVGEYVLVAEIEKEDDNNDNNKASIDVNVIIGLNPVVNDLKAVSNKEEGTVTLTWSKPDIKLTGEEGFEDYAPFEYGKYIGNFKNVDLDGKKTYSYDQCVFDAAGVPKAFMVINPEHLNNRLVQENYAPHSGSQYLVAFCPADGSKADDWLISPEVKPGTPVTFYVTTVVLSNYSETYEICYSTTGNNPADFKVLEKQSVTGVNWTGKAVMLPEDAKYFAIHYTSADVFGIMFDDINYTPVINEKSEFKYNIYSDGQLIDTNIADTNYVVNGVTNHDSGYNVTAVVDGKEYAMSNTAIPEELSAADSITATTGSITVVGHDVVFAGYAGQQVTVYSVDGTTVFTARAEDVTVATLGSGIYVATAGKDVRKIAVR